MHFASVCRRSMFIVVYQELAKHGIAVEVGIVERNGALGKMQSLYVRDPDNNLVEISRYE